MLARLFCVTTLAMAAVLVPRTSAQVQTEVPPAVPGAKTLTVEHVPFFSRTLYSPARYR